MEKHTEECYGLFPGGDPRKFIPDPECSTEQERKNHCRDCIAYTKNPKTKLIGGYGLGTYEIEITDEEYTYIHSIDK
jgi:hypothetical protein